MDGVGVLGAFFVLLNARSANTADVWTAMVITSDVPAAGSTANVFADVIGHSGAIGNVSLGNSHPRGGVKYSTIHMTVGVPYRLQIWHDNTGDGPDWRLEQVVLISHQTWQQYMFICRCWLSSTGFLFYELDPKGYLYIPGMTERIVPMVTDSKVSMDITVQDQMGRAKVKVTETNSRGRVDGALITIETDHVFMGSDSFVINVKTVNQLYGKCEHTSDCLCYERVPKNRTTTAEVNHLMKKLKEELTVDKKKTSSNLRRYISAKDDRPSSQAIGAVGAVLLAIPVVLVVLNDLLTLCIRNKRRSPPKCSRANSSCDHQILPTSSIQRDTRKQSRQTESSMSIAFADDTDDDFSADSMCDTPVLST